MDEPGMLNLGSNPKNWDYLLQGSWDCLLVGNPKYWDYLLEGNLKRLIPCWWAIPGLGTSENIRIAPIVPFQSIIILPNMFSPPRKDIGQNVRKTLNSDQYLLSPKLWPANMFWLSYFITPVWLTSSIMWFSFTAYFVICWFWRFIKLKCIYITNKLYSYKIQSVLLWWAGMGLFIWDYTWESCCWAFLEITQFRLWPCLNPITNFWLFQCKKVFYLNNNIVATQQRDLTQYCELYILGKFNDTQDLKMDFY